MHCLILANKADDRARSQREVTDEDIRVGTQEAQEQDWLYRRRGLATPVAR
jgi:hypothetical protein